MSKEFKEFIEFELTTPIKDIYKGNNVDKNDIADCNKLYLKANTPKHKEQTRELKRLLFRAVSFLQLEMRGANQNDQQEDSKDDSKLDKEWIRSMFLLSKIDFPLYSKIFKKFALNNICYTDKDFKHLIKSDYYDNLSEDDEENLIASYLEVFFIHSWFPTDN